MALNKTGKNGHRDSVPVAATAAHVEEQGDEAARARTIPSPRNPATAWRSQSYNSLQKSNNARAFLLQIQG